MPRPGFPIGAAAVAASLVGTPLVHAESGSWCGTGGAGATASLAAHREARQRWPRVVRQTAAAGAADFDDGEVAVLLDEGDLTLPSNLFDLQRAGLVFAPAGDGYSVTRVDAAPLGETGEPLPLGDDDSKVVDIPFGFPFFGREYTRVWVNSDGNVTFDGADSESTARDLGRFLEGLPRVAPLLADLDPSSGGRVTAAASPDRLVVTWSEVPQFDETDSNTFQAILRADGIIEMSWSNVSGRIVQGVIGISPGAGGGDFSAVDLSRAAGEAAGGALGESLRADAELDLVATSQRFFRTHADAYDQLVIFTSRRLVRHRTFAYERNIRSQIRGIGLPVFDLGADYGSPTRLSSVAMMDWLAKYPLDPAAVFLGEDDTLDVLAHETGHRWLASARFVDGNELSDELLGRQLAHWNFFLDSDGSYLEGNDIEDEGGGLYRTVGASQRYGPLDLYLMGLLPAESVPPALLVRPADASEEERERSPEVGVTLSGERRDVTIDEILAALGPRFPVPAPQVEPWRQAFVWVGVDGPPTPAELARLETIRLAWEARFAESTDGLWSVNSRLR